MRSATMSRRRIVQAAVALLAAVGVTPRARAGAAPPEIRLPEGVPVERVDFETKGIEGWTPVDGQWAVEDMAGAPSGTRALVQRATVKAPALGQWHTVRVVAIGDHMQAWLDGKLYLDHHDARFKSGRVGLWTKADSITAFDDLTIRGVGVKVS